MRLPTSVLDASALIAFMHDEDGKSVVAAALAGRAVISVVQLGRGSLEGGGGRR